MATTTEPVEPSAVLPRLPARRRRRVVTYVVAVLLALVALGAVDWTAHRLTHISMYGAGFSHEAIGSCSDPAGNPQAVTTRGFAVGIGIYGVDRPARVTFTGVTAISPSSNMVLERAFLVPGVLLGTADYASLSRAESAYQLANTVTPGGQIFAIPKTDQDRNSGDRWNLIVVLRTTDPTQTATVSGFQTRFDAPWHVAVTATSHLRVTFTPDRRCGTP